MKIIALMVLAACSTNPATGTADGGNDDGTNDGPPTGTVSVTVINAEVPAANVKVSFQNADSSLVATVMTDAAGVASTELAAGGFVTIFNPFGADAITIGDRLHTIADVKPGDQLIVSLPRFTPLDVDLTIPKDPGATGYTVHASCGASIGVSDANTTAYPIRFGNCVPPVDFLIVSKDAQQTPLRTLHALQVMPVGRNLTITGTYEPMATATFDYTNIPSNIARVRLSYDLGAPGEVLFEGFDMTTQISGGAAAVSIAIPDKPFAALKTETFENGANLHALVRRYDSPAPRAHTTDLAGVLLPEFSTTPVFDTATHAFTWTPVAGTATPDFAFANQRYTRVGTETKRWVWTVIAPYAGGSLAYPQLPIDGFDYNTGPGEVAVEASLYIAKVPGGYDAVRPQIHSGGFEPAVGEQVVTNQSDL